MIFSVIVSIVLVWLVHAGIQIVTLIYSNYDRIHLWVTVCWMKTLMHKSTKFNTFIVMLHKRTIKGFCPSITNLFLYDIFEAWIDFGEKEAENPTNIHDDVFCDIPKWNKSKNATYMHATLLITRLNSDCSSTKKNY